MALDEFTQMTLTGLNLGLMYALIAIGLVHPALLDASWIQRAGARPARRLAVRVRRRLPPLLGHRPDPAEEPGRSGGEIRDPA